MRHDLAAGPVTTGTGSMGKAPRSAALVALTGRLLRGPACGHRAPAAAINLASIATAAQHYLHAATRAQEHPASRGHRRSGISQSVCWTPCKTDAILPVSLGASASKCGARRRIDFLRWTVAALVLLWRADYPGKITAPVP